VLLVGLSLAVVLDLVLARNPGWLGDLLGEQRLAELLASGREEPAVAVTPPKVRTGPAAARREKAQLRGRIDRQLPYDEEGRLDLNRADSTSLVLLKGVGPVLAGRILAQRRRLGGFGATGDLLGVRGIGPRTLAKLLPQITLGVVHDSLAAPPHTP
jgi:hypothetical protein